MINTDTWTPNQIGHALAEVLKRLGVADREASAVVVNMLVALVEQIPEGNSTSLHWVDEVASTALQIIAHSQIRAVMNTIRTEMYAGTANPTTAIISTGVLLGDTISVNVAPDKQWEVLSVDRCRKHGTLEPWHPAYLVEQNSSGDSWICGLQVTKVGDTGNGDNS